MTTYQIGNTSSTHAKRPVTTHYNNSLTLYEAKRCGSSWVAVTVQGGKVQVRGEKWMALEFCKMNNPQEA